MSMRALDEINKVNVYPILEVSVALLGTFSPPSREGSFLGVSFALLFSSCRLSSPHPPPEKHHSSNSHVGSRVVIWLRFKSSFLYKYLTVWHYILLLEIINSIN